MHKLYEGLCKIREGFQPRTSLCKNSMVRLLQGLGSSLVKGIMPKRKKKSILDQSRTFELLPNNKSQLSLESIM